MIEWLKLKTESYDLTPWLCIWCVAWLRLASLSQICKEMWKIRWRWERERISLNSVVICQSIPSLNSSLPMFPAVVTASSAHVIGWEVTYICFFLPNAGWMGIAMGLMLKSWINTNSYRKLLEKTASGLKAKIY